MSPIDKLTQLFEKFPGIGPRQARRFVQYLLAASPALRQELGEAIKSLGSNTAQCKKCYRWFVKEGGKTSECSICSDPSRDRGTLFVVEKDADIEVVDRSGYRGLYFVLGGTVPLGSQEPEKYLRVSQLVKRVQDETGVLKELILGLSATTEGDHTREYLQERLRPHADNLKVSSLGRGLSTGSELEYADPDTIAQALGNRH